MELSSDGSTANFSTVGNHSRAWKAPMNMWKEMRPCAGSAFLIAIFRGGAWTGLTCAGQFCGRNELLPRARASTCVQQTCPSTFGYLIGSYGYEASIGWFLKERQACQAVFGIVEIRSLELFVLRVSLVCRRFLPSWVILRWSLINFNWLLANIGHCVLDGSLMVVTEDWWSVVAWFCLFPFIGGRCDGAKDTFPLSFALRFSVKLKRAVLMEPRTVAQ